MALLNVNETVRAPGEWQASKQHRVHDREHRNVQRDRKREHRNRGQRESAIPTQTSPGESKIVDDRFKLPWESDRGHRRDYIATNLCLLAVLTPFTAANGVRNEG